MLPCLKPRQKIITAVSTFLFVGAVNAASDSAVYGGWAKANADLSSDLERTVSMSPVQPGIGDSFDLYHGWANGNPDISTFTKGARLSRAEAPDIYGAFGNGNPDL